MDGVYALEDDQKVGRVVFPVCETVKMEADPQSLPDSVGLSTMNVKFWRQLPFWVVLQLEQGTS